MKFATILLAGVTIAISASSALAQLATANSLPSDLTVGATTTKTAKGTVVVPASSLAKAEDAGRSVHTNVRFLVLDDAGTVKPMAVKPAAGAPPYSGYPYETPASLACIYGMVAKTNNCVPDLVTTNATGGSKAIAIVDAYHYPNAKADLTYYSTQFGLPAPTAANFQQVDMAGGTGSTSDGWGLEAALDIQMAHAMAPSAKIILVEAKTNSYTDMYAAVAKARSMLVAIGGGQVSQSWGSDEWSTEKADFDGYYIGTNVTYFASTGDAVTPSWPAVSQRVVAVGGTTVARNPSNLAFKAEDSWVDAGAGFSRYIPRPAWQPSTVGSMRGVPDISAVANPATGVWVRFTPASYSSGYWYTVGGTSVSSPLMAGIVNKSGHFKASTAAESQMIYAAKAAAATNFRISRTGDCGYYFAYAVSAGWNPCTGVGSPINTTNQ